MSLLCLEHVTKSYPSQALPAVDDLSLQLEKGEILALLGPSGCGKTTTLRLIAGFEIPDAGLVEIGGQVMANGHLSIPPEQRGVGVVFQEYTLFPHLTVEDNVRFGLHRFHAQERTQRLRDMLEVVGLAAFLDVTRTNSPVDSNSGWPWPGRWHHARPCCSWMSLSVIWMPTCARKCCMRSMPFCGN